MKQVIIGFLFFLSFSFALPHTVCAQDNLQGTVKMNTQNDKGYLSRSPLARYRVNTLREGTLIVRLVSYQAKIDVLKKQKRFDEAEELFSDNKKHHQILQQEFANNYEYSDVVYCYGKDLESYLDGTNQNIFLNENLEVDPKISVKEGPILILGSQAGGEYFLYDNKFNPIPRPAPSLVNFDEKHYKHHFIKWKFLNKLNAKTAKSIKAFNNKLFKISGFPI